MRVAIMRPRDRLALSAQMARELGMEPICASPVEVSENDDQDFQDFMDELLDGNVETVVFTSASGVKVSMELADRRGMREELGEMLRSVSIISIGPHTSAPLEREGLSVDFMPREFSSTGIVSDVPEPMVRGRRVWLLRSDHGSGSLVEGLLDLGAILREVVVYRLERNLDGEDMVSLLRSVSRGEVDAFAFTSALSARTFVEAGALLMGEDRLRNMLERGIVGAIGEPTSKALDSMGVRVDTVPRDADFRELLQSIRLMR